MAAMLDDRNNEIFWPENRFHLLFSERGEILLFLPSNIGAMQLTSIVFSKVEACDHFSDEQSVHISILKTHSVIHGRTL